MVLVVVALWKTTLKKKCKDMGWKDQYQPLPVLSAVAIVTVEGQPATHLCLSLSAVWIEICPNVICCVCTAAAMRTRFESITDCCRPKCPEKIKGEFYSWLVKKACLEEFIRGN